jgi:hypothetical protein
MTVNVYRNFPKHGRKLPYTRKIRSFTTVYGVRNHRPGYSTTTSASQYSPSSTTTVSSSQPWTTTISTSQQNFLHFEPSAIRHPTRLNFHQPFVHFEPQAMANRPVTNYPHPSFSNSGQQYLYSEIYDEEDTNE